METACKLSSKPARAGGVELVQVAQERVAQEDLDLPLKGPDLLAQGLGQAPQERLHGARGRAGVGADAVLLELLLRQLRVRLRVRRPPGPELPQRLGALLLELLLSQRELLLPPLRRDELRHPAEVGRVPADGRPDALPARRLLGADEPGHEDGTGHLLRPLLGREDIRSRLMCTDRGDGIVRLDQQSHRTAAVVHALLHCLPKLCSQRV
mmetsp:Transcript_4448/g.13039  ORF Transcript_4448/g.13039 Transcript_4448/m.13039 type:complete len:210 (-) Transcript_4448:846-1475(-)